MDIQLNSKKNYKKLIHDVGNKKKQIKITNIW